MNLEGWVEFQVEMWKGKNEGREKAWAKIQRKERACAFAWRRGGKLAGKSWQTALTDKGLKIKWQISVK